MRKIIFLLLLLLIVILHANQKSLKRDLYEKSKLLDEVEDRMDIMEDKYQNIVSN
ncbi:hypothetical protein ACFL1M_03405 [Patescibacteria group bacterium]